MERKKRFMQVAFWTIVIILLSAIFCVIVAYGPFDISCNIYKLTGLSCSGCGITRMGRAMLHGQTYQAFRYNSFIFLSIPVGILLYFIASYRYIRYNSKNNWIIRALSIYAILLFAFGVIRNIPVFHWLLPTIIN